jgi:tRNA nucleotidyltransferase (CCA-adding enzyme)
VVEPATIEADLGRRDFTVNAMAIPLHEPAHLIDPHGGLADLEQGQLRVLHDRSFIDDPTRVLRAARYVARLGMRLEERTRDLAQSANLGSVSADRVSAELGRLAVEPNVSQGFALLDDLGLASGGGYAPLLVDDVAHVFEDPEWRAFADTGRAILAAARRQGLAGAEDLAATVIASPSQAVDLASQAEPEQLVLARALGAEWLDRWLREWRSVRLEITGEDLLAKGIEEGPGIGRGLAAALRAKLDGEASGHEEELAIALLAAREE